VSIVVAISIATPVTWNRANPAPVPSMSPGAFGPSLALVSTRTERATRRMATVLGEVRNITAGPLARTVVVVTWRDERGVFLTSEEALLERDPLPAGETSRFSVVSPLTPGMAAYVVRFTTLRGEYLAMQDERRDRSPRE
jgi:hypothetical protein